MRIESEKGLHLRLFQDECAYCGTRLRPIKNDWKGRTMHLSCIKLLSQVTGENETGLRVTSRLAFFLNKARAKSREQENKVK